MIYFYQIFWNDEQKKNFFEWSIPYKNEKLTPFFENSVIIDIFNNKKFENNDRVGIFSWNLKQKMFNNIPPYRQLTIEVLNSDYDVLSLTKNSRGFGMLRSSEVWHPGFISILRKICEKIELKIPSEVKYPIFQNAFMAKSEIYKRYVDEVLKEAVYVMENDFEICKLSWSDSNYYKLKSNPEFSSQVKKYLGTDFCPLHTFLCERLFSVWLEDKNFKIEYI